MGERKIILTTLVFDGELLTKRLECGLRRIRIFEIDFRCSLRKMIMHDIQTALDMEGKVGYPRHPVVKIDARLTPRCVRCSHIYKSMYYFVGDRATDRKFDFGFICSTCYVKTGNDIIIKMRIEKLD